MSRIILTLAALALTATAHAFRFSDAQFGASLVRPVSAPAPAAPAAGEADAGVIKPVLAAFSGQSGPCGLVSQWLQAHKTVVEFKDLGGPLSSRSKTGDKIFLDSSLLRAPVSARLMGSLIAAETSELILAEFPETAEKRYMSAATVTAAYLALGGKPGAPADFDGRTSKAVADIIQTGSYQPDLGVAIFKLRGHESLKDRIIALEEERQYLIDGGGVVPPELERELQAALSDYRRFETFLPRR